jgi:hypothetical protein
VFSLGFDSARRFRLVHQGKFDDPKPVDTGRTALGPLPKLNTRVRFPSSPPRIPAETLPPTASVTAAYLPDTCDWSVSRAKGANYIRYPQPVDNPVGVNQQFNVP